MFEDEGEFITQYLGHPQALEEATSASLAFLVFEIVNVVDFDLNPCLGNELQKWFHSFAGNFTPADLMKVFNSQLEDSQLSSTWIRYIKRCKN